MKYNLIYADPAWQFNNKKTGGSMASGAESKYRVSSLQEMSELDIESIAADDCVLAMWWVGAMPKEAITLAESWGFEVKNMNGFVWNKLTKNGLPFFGMGFWTRAGSESVLIATRGKPKPISRAIRAVFRSESQIQFEAVVGDHSSKPKEVRDALVELVGDVPRLEMFCRGSADGWDTWGDQSTESIFIPRKQIDGVINIKKWLKNVTKSWSLHKANKD